ncbi:GDSL-type esterase/lipase family protein [Leuconostocaceae bacterium ESL0723]|nr:GDSL-type esterase/lipase family protein [Leuconostocaceae bacterium ESL0723]
MTSADTQAFLSPEWGLSEAGLVTSQYGAIVDFISPAAGPVTLEFLEPYPALTFTVLHDGVAAGQVTLTGNQLKINVAAGHNQLVLDQLDQGQVALWQNGVVLTAIRTDLDLKPVPVDKPYLTFVGDSITAGELMAGNQNLPAQSFPSLVSQQVGRPLARIAYGGTGLTRRAPFQEPTAITALWQVSPGIARPRVQTDLVIVNYGLNDFNYGASRQEFTFGLRVYLLELVKRFHDAKVLLLTPFNGEYVDIFQQESRRFDHLEVVDTSDWAVLTANRHPNVEEHQRAAEHILALRSFKEL